MPHVQGCLIRSLKSRVDLNARSLIPSLRAEAPGPVWRANRSHLVLAALRTIATFLTQRGAPCKSTIVLGGSSRDLPSGGGAPNSVHRARVQACARCPVP